MASNINVSRTKALQPSWVNRLQFKGNYRELPRVAPLSHTSSRRTAVTPLKILVGLASAIGLLGFAAGSMSNAKPTPPRTNQCFLGRQVNGFSPVTDSIVDIQVGANRYYRLSLDSSCPSAAFNNRIALRTLTGVTWICHGLDAEIVVPDAMGGQRCLVRDIQPITKDQWQADGHPHR
jgi:hypothetical protein